MHAHATDELHSRIANGKTGVPSGHKESEFHPRLRSSSKIIDTAPSLKRALTR